MMLFVLTSFLPSPNLTSVQTNNPCLSVSVYVSVCLYRLQS